MSNNRLFMLRDKRTLKLLGINLTANGDDAEFCNETTARLSRDGDAMFTVDNYLDAAKVLICPASWYVSCPKYPMLDGIKSEEIEIVEIDFSDDGSTAKVEVHDYPLPLMLELSYIRDLGRQEQEPELRRVYVNLVTLDSDSQRYVYGTLTNKKDIAKVREHIGLLVYHGRWRKLLLVDASGRCYLGESRGY